MSFYNLIDLISCNVFNFNESECFYWIKIWSTFYFNCSYVYETTRLSSFIDYADYDYLSDDDVVGYKMSWGSVYVFCDVGVWTPIDLDLYEMIVSGV